MAGLLDFGIVQAEEPSPVARQWKWAWLGLILERLRIAISNVGIPGMEGVQEEGISSQHWVLRKIPLSHPAQMKADFDSFQKRSGDHISNPSWSQPVCGKISNNLCPFPPACHDAVSAPISAAAPCEGLDLVLLQAQRVRTGLDGALQLPSHGELRHCSGNNATSNHKLPLKF